MPEANNFLISIIGKVGEAVAAFNKVGTALKGMSKEQKTAEALQKEAKAAFVITAKEAHGMAKVMVGALGEVEHMQVRMRPAFEGVGADTEALTKQFAAFKTETTDAMLQAGGAFARIGVQGTANIARISIATAKMGKALNITTAQATQGMAKILSAMRLTGKEAIKLTGTITALSAKWGASGGEYLDLIASLSPALARLGGKSTEGALAASRALSQMGISVQDANAGIKDLTLRMLDQSTGSRLFMGTTMSLTTAQKLMAGSAEDQMKVYGELMGIMKGCNTQVEMENRLRQHGIENTSDLGIALSTLGGRYGEYEQAVKDVREQMRKEQEENAQWLKLTNTLKGSLDAFNKEITKLWQSMGTYLLPIIGGVLKALEFVMFMFNLLPGPIKGAIGVIFGVVAAISLLQIGLNYLDQFTKAATFVRYILGLMGIGKAAAVTTPKVWSLNAALTANPVGLIIAAIVLLIAVLVAGTLMFVKGEGAVKKWGLAILLAAGPIGWLIIGIVQLVKHWDTVVTWLKKYWMYLVLLASPIGITIGLIKLIAVYWDKISQKIKENWKLLVALTGPIGWVILLVYKLIKSWERVKAVVKGIIMIIWVSFKWVFDKIVAGWKWTFEKIKDGLLFLPRMISNVWKSVKDAIVSAWNTVKDFLRGLVNDAKAAGQALWDNIPRPLQWIAEQAMRAKKKIFGSGLLHIPEGAIGAKSGLVSIVNMLGRVADEAGNAKVALDEAFANRNAKLGVTAGAASGASAAAGAEAGARQNVRRGKSGGSQVKVTCPVTVELDGMIIARAMKEFLVDVNQERYMNEPNIGMRGVTP